MFQLCQSKTNHVIQYWIVLLLALFIMRVIYKFSKTVIASVAKQSPTSWVADRPRSPQSSDITVWTPSRRLNKNLVLSIEMANNCPVLQGGGSSSNQRAGLQSNNNLISFVWRKVGRSLRGACAEKDEALAKTCGGNWGACKPQSEGWDNLPIAISLSLIIGSLSSMMIFLQSDILEFKNHLEFIILRDDILPVVVYWSINQRKKHDGIINTHRPNHLCHLCFNGYRRHHRDG